MCLFICFVHKPLNSMRFSNDFLKIWNGLINGITEHRVPGFPCREKRFYKIIKSMGWMRHLLLKNPTQNTFNDIVNDNDERESKWMDTKYSKPKGNRTESIEMKKKKKVGWFIHRFSPFMSVTFEILLFLGLY